MFKTVALKTENPKQSILPLEGKYIFHTLKAV